MENQNFCSNCGMPAEPGQRFCMSCGSKLSEAAPTYTAAPEPAPAPQPAPQPAPAPQPVYQQAPQSSYAQPAGEAPMSGMCIAGFITSLLGLFPLNLIFSIVGVVGCKKKGLRGKGLGVAGIIISIIEFVLIILLFFATIGIGIVAYLDEAKSVAKKTKQSKLEIVLEPEEYLADYTFDL